MQLFFKLHVILRTAGGFPDDERFWPASQIGIWLSACPLMLLGGLAHRQLLPGPANLHVIENFGSIAFVAFVIIFGGSFLLASNKRNYERAECSFRSIPQTSQRRLQIAVPVLGILSFLAAIYWFVSAL